MNLMKVNETVYENINVLHYFRFAAVTKCTTPEGWHSLYFNLTNYGFIAGSFVRLWIVFTGSGPT